MATKLEKNIIRESTVLVGDKEIMVTLTSDQTINLKLKGLRSGTVSISIEELWHQLNGTDGNDDKPNKGSISIVKTKKVKNNPMMSLHDIRSYNAISGLDYPTLVKFEGILKNLIDNYPEKYGKYSR